MADFWYPRSLRGTYPAPMPQIHFRLAHYPHRIIADRDEATQSQRDMKAVPRRHACCGKAFWHGPERLVTGRLGGEDYWQVMAGQRPTGSAVATGLAWLDLRLLRDLERIVDLDPEVPHGAFKFRVAKQQLNGAQILRATVDQRRFGAPH